MALSSPVWVPPNFRGSPVVIDTNRLRTARLAAGWTQEHLAHRAEITTATYCRIENGRQDPNLMTVRALYAAFGWRVDLRPEWKHAWRRQLDGPVPRQFFQPDGVAHG